MPQKMALIVAGDPELDRMLSRILPQPDWSIQDAATNQTALRLVQAERFELIVTGETTSGKEDVDLLRKIRIIHPHMRVIILTDESTPEDAVAAMREGAFVYFSKPFTFESLADMVKAATESPCWDDGIEVVSSVPGWIRLMARCDMQTANRLLQFFYEMSDLPETEKQDVGMAFREMLLNAMEHGGHFDPHKYVEISYYRTKRMVACRLKDPGEGFSLNEIPHAAVMNPPDDPFRHLAHRDAQQLRPGGFGVLLARNLIDELRYNEQGNEVVFVKYLDPPGSRDSKN